MTKLQNNLAFLLLSFLLFTLPSCAEVGSEVTIGLELTGVPTTVELGTVVKISLFAESDSELDFDYDWRPSEYNWSIATRATLIKQKNSALFTWDPTGADVLSDQPIQITFIAKDDKGRRSEKTVSFRVTFGEGGPEFVSSVSELYDPRSKQPVTFNVKIKHPSCANSDCVDIKLDDSTAPVGARFVHGAPLGGTFTWTPLPDQLKTRVHTVTFIADDGDAPPVSHDVSIVIRNEPQITNPMDDNACPGESLLTHLPLGPKRGLTEGYDISIKTTETEFDDIVVYWALGSELDVMREVFSAKLTASNGEYKGQIPSVANLIDPNIGALNIDYQICGVKNGGEGDDAFTCIPSFAAYSFVASLPDGPACLEDKSEPNNTEFAATTVSTEKWEYFHACAGDDDFIVTDSLNEEESTLIFVYNKDAQIDFVATDGEGNNVPLTKSPCTGATFLDTSTSAGGGFFKVKVSGNNVPFRVRKRVFSGGPGNCVDEAFEPNDDGDTATPVTSGQNLSAEICNGEEIDVYKISANAGDNLKITTNFSNAKGDLDMTLFEGVDKENIENGFGVETTISVDDEEILEHRVQVSGDFYLKVENVDYTRNTYTIKFEVDQAPPCDTDKYSVQDNHSKATGTFLQTPAGGTLFEENLEVCPDNSDWYKRTEFSGVPLTGRLISTNRDAITWRLFDLDGNILTTAIPIVGASGASDELSITFTPPKTMAIFHEISTTQEAEYAFELVR